MNTETSPPVVDVRGLECPKPFQQASSEAMMLSPGDSFTLHIGIHPQPLLDYLQQRNFATAIETTAEGEFMIKITARENPLQPGATVVEGPPSAPSQ
ncbi:MAG: DUF2249 domain-containing protein [Gammaproteobacteria bacterium]|nr:DUF2249 domain-containing protein [Gammaproteobacteria bacterium]MBT4607883.1 DUF2249 domain-containing protein [Thiotrichales bacterium]MBT3472054.1 DUF2249 domain-containing protein [Gammaproteobacteria bacterium]MBT3967315.1 DUF2249 domain-containing protein [Gammaproteobacteria bacterium]MBT4080487.1 DUF2249 domain-containing protein [Gammaproteobacteria bacterium]